MPLTLAGARSLLKHPPPSIKNPCCRGATITRLMPRWAASRGEIVRKTLLFQALVGWCDHPRTGLRRADLYGAAQAYDQKDFARSFQLYRELAELGQIDAQYNLAIMYVSGEGVARDNVAGYAWAAIARENGGGEGMQSIIDQIEPHMNEKGRKRVEEIKAQFGNAAPMSGCCRRSSRGANTSTALPASFRSRRIFVPQDAKQRASRQRVHGIHGESRRRARNPRWCCGAQWNFEMRPADDHAFGVQPVTQKGRAVPAPPA